MKPPDLSQFKSRQSATKYFKQLAKEKGWDQLAEIGYWWNGTFWKADGNLNTKGVRFRNMPERRLEEAPGGSRYASKVARGDKRARSIETSSASKPKVKKVREVVTNLRKRTDDPITFLEPRLEHIEKVSDPDWSNPSRPFLEGDVENVKTNLKYNPEGSGWARKDAFENMLDASGLDYKTGIVGSGEFWNHLVAVPRRSFNPSEPFEFQEGAIILKPDDKLEDVIDSIRKVEAARVDRVGRSIGGGRYERARFDPTTGMRIDEDIQFAIQQQKAAQESAQTFTDRPFWNTVEDALSKPFTLDPESEFAKLGVWHDGPTLDDSWVKISRELNLESGKFDDATGVFHYSKDPTARTSIDILSDIGEGKGEFGDIVNLKNKFHGLKRSLPPGEYYLHADNPTKAKYYQRAFANDPWIGPSGEQGGGRLKSGEYVKYDTLKLTVPEAPEQFAQAQDGPWPRWEDQGVPRTQLSSEASDVARRTGALGVASDAGTLGRRVGAVLPFVGAGFDAWDVQARYHEMINNPNEGFADWLDRAQFGIASATLGTSFWAEPANAVLGLGNLGIDAIRTVVEEDKRKEFGQMMRGIGQFATKLF